MKNKPHYRQRRIGDLLPGAIFLFWGINSLPVTAKVGCRLGNYRVQVTLGHIKSRMKYFNMSVDHKVWVKVS